MSQLFSSSSTSSFADSSLIRPTSSSNSGKRRSLSNLVQQLPSPPATSPVRSSNDNLLHVISDQERAVTVARADYEQHHDKFVTLARRFHAEKLANLKLTFRNQMLKQQIYFETELFELCKECYESATGADGKEEESRIKLVKMCKSDMRKLVNYMRESLLSSADTLIEAHETCQVLKSLEQCETNFRLKNSLLVRASASSSTTSTTTSDETKTDDDNDGVKTPTNSSNNQLEQDELLFAKHKSDMDELMHALDSIELQHLQRKEVAAMHKKSAHKLKAKFKFIESKYDALARQCAQLRHEQRIFARLWHEKQLIIEKQQSTTTSSGSSSTASLSPSTSRSSLDNIEHEASSYQHQQEMPDIDLIDDEQEESGGGGGYDDGYDDDDAQCSRLPRAPCVEDDDDVSSSSSSLSGDASTSTTNSDVSPPSSSSSIDDHDYLRKLALISDLIGLHKSKNSPSSTTHHQPSIENENSELYLATPTSSASAAPTVKSGQTYRLKSSWPEHRHYLVNLSECSVDGDLVCLDNCDLKAACDVSEWHVTREIEDGAQVDDYTLPHGSIIGAGKCLRLQAPFLRGAGSGRNCHFLDYLLAIKHKYGSGEAVARRKSISVKIRTKLLTPEGMCRAMHVQEVPQFYLEIYKYASLIEIL